MHLAYLDYHTCGEPVRIVTGGYPVLKGATILEKRRDARENHDHLRRAMMLEPRGHAGMYGVIPVASSHPEAAFGVLFTHNEGYSTMCGHATIALGRYAIEHGLVPAAEPVTRFAIEAPCGLLRLECTVRDGKVDSVVFESVPAFVFARDLAVALPGYGDIVTDIAYGGAFYCILPASRFGLDLFETPVTALTDAAAALTDHLRASLPITHPSEPDLGFLYGTIITDEAQAHDESFNLCIFAEAQIDRSPTGSGVTARMALDHAKGVIQTGRTRRFRSITGGTFTGSVVGPVAGFADGAVTVAVGGTGHFAGQGSFTIEAGDPLGHGFALPTRFAEIARG
ncbi:MULTISPECIES: proline racemase family protein [Hyphomicrobiales]|jgi:trans-L-3-hydroxyproline dehydratase|uniref:proline racemase family protein n=1 Tax=Methylobacterium sp. CCH7-A2 TaxID=1768789 RepID=UPI00082CCC4B|nr:MULTISPECIES: proline racemase family protein [Hyphomicrobiales]